MVCTCLEFGWQLLSWQLLSCFFCYNILEAWTEQLFIRSIILGGRKRVKKEKDGEIDGMRNIKEMGDALSGYVFVSKQ